VDDRDDIAAIAAALGCTHDAAVALHAAGRVQIYASPTILVHQGDVAQRSWLILDGSVRCEVVSPEGRNTVVSTHPAGDIVGGYGLGNIALAGSLATMPRSRLLGFTDEAIELLAANDPVFAIALARSFARQSAWMMQRLAARISLTAAGRICARLLELADSDNSIRPAPVVSALAVGVQTTRETTSRTLSSLERRGIISRDGAILQINSPRMLEDLIV
jgi:CRP/FNR family cyclic AMP-dependent transcriptional regulator